MSNSYTFATVSWHCVIFPNYFTPLAYSSNTIFEDFLANIVKAAVELLTDIMSRCESIDS